MQVFVVLFTEIDYDQKDDSPLRQVTRVEDAVATEEKAEAVLADLRRKDHVIAAWIDSFEMD